VAIDSAVSDRFELVTVPRAKGVPSFAEEVAVGLSAAPKRLPSKFHYDDVGSALFDAIKMCIRDRPYTISIPGQSRRPN